MDLTDKHPVLVTLAVLVAAFFATYLIYYTIPVGIINVQVCGTTNSPNNQIYIFSSPGGIVLEGPLSPQITATFSGRYFWTSVNQYTTGQVLYFANSQAPASYYKFQVLGTIAPAAASSLPCLSVGSVSGYF